MKIKTDISYNTIRDSDLVKEKVVTGWLESVVKKLGLDDCICSISFVSSEQIQKINRDYRGDDLVTDVLSFSQLEGEEVCTTVPRLLGDIVICIDRALEQADTIGHTLDEEIKFLLLHGFLHLLGYDHETEKNDEMEQLQQRLYYELTGVRLE